MQAGHLVGKFEGVAEAEEVAPETEFDLEVDGVEPETKLFLSTAMGAVILTAMGADIYKIFWGAASGTACGAAIGAAIGAAFGAACGAAIRAAMGTACGVAAGAAIGTTHGAVAGTALWTACVVAAVAALGPGRRDWK